MELGATGDAKRRRLSRTSSSERCRSAGRTLTIVCEAREELTEALLGDEVVEDRLSESGTVRTYLVRQGGFWFKGGKPTHTNVSAVLLLPKAGIWHLREPGWQPFMALNPWAESPIDTALLPLPRFAAQDDKWAFLEGTHAAGRHSAPPTRLAPE